MFFSKLQKRNLTRYGENLQKSQSVAQSFGFFQMSYSRIQKYRIEFNEAQIVELIE